MHRSFLKRTLLTTVCLPALSGLAIPILRDPADFDGRDPLTGRIFEMKTAPKQ